MLKMICCERCQVFWTCELKWYRGERHEENLCCERCDYYRVCLDKLAGTGRRKKKPARSSRAGRRK